MVQTVLDYAFPTAEKNPSCPYVPAEWSLEKAVDMAEAEGLTLTEEHVKVFTRQEKNATEAYYPATPAAPLFHAVASPVAFHSATNTINDFKRQPLLVNPLSFSGPCLVKADVNGYGLEDVYAGGGSGQAGALYLQQKDGRFVQKTEPAFEADKQSEDADAVFFDANGDGFIDLYIVSGGYHQYTDNDPLLQDRLYLNDGKGNFTKAADALPLMHASKSCARIADVNGDGKPDLFVGGRVIPGRYPETPPSYLLINDGKGHFTDQAATLAPALQRIGMITDALRWREKQDPVRFQCVVEGGDETILQFRFQIDHQVAASCTPSMIKELVAGFLLSENIVSDAASFSAVRIEYGEKISVVLPANVINGRPVMFRCLG